LNDVPAVALGWPAHWQHFELSRGPALGRYFLAEFAAGFGFAVKSLRDGRWAARVAELQNFYFEVAAIVGDSQHVSDANFARGLGGLTVRLNPAKVTGFRG
jgi:hypothetical protein